MSKCRGTPDYETFSQGYYKYLIASFQLLPLDFLLILLTFNQSKPYLTR